ncbi:mannose-6-phosphate isomerase, class I [Desulfotomaculum nigrificans CO-1-SRB]|uniref:Phosphohexomutase n=1 Tax=Desulfotomaculum nigrificans (strain DSM 14880 / VKM B-2319 / CO-1-SRB) TaxID=868595 RepID=F6BA27_DESCC|nr:type I phosphomannose isomerase catalytic subunit [Desulfotomaculum nigrificans]AEF94996.1 mannose-6-phosphate isomerase, class I [Desulfotomaculum nigrificans CO-1-SRB]
MLYPLKFEPVYKNYIWGGRNLELLGRKLPDGKIAESWEVSCHPCGLSTIANGDYKGLSLLDFLKKFKRRALGTAMEEKYAIKFPLLVKLIDANDRLSVQVHPDDDYARSHEGEVYGKNEMWYVLRAKPGAGIIYGLAPGVTRDAFEKAITDGELAKCLRSVQMSAGDVVYIPAGTVHALGEGLMVLEIQQNSNITYRVYDYDRVCEDGTKRPLQIERALEVMHFEEASPTGKIKGLHIAQGDKCTVRYLAACSSFAAELYDIRGSMQENTGGERFFVYTVIEGEGEIVFNGNQRMAFRAVESFLVPAFLGAYTLYGDFKAVKSYLPDLERNVILPLRKAGYSDYDICHHIGGLAACPKTFRKNYSA